MGRRGSSSSPPPPSHALPRIRVQGSVSLACPAPRRSSSWTGPEGPRETRSSTYRVCIPGWSRGEASSRSRTPGPHLLDFELSLVEASGGSGPSLLDVIHVTVTETRRPARASTEERCLRSGSTARVPRSPPESRAASQFVMRWPEQGLGRMRRYMGASTVPSAINRAGDRQAHPTEHRLSRVRLSRALPQRPRRRDGRPPAGPPPAGARPAPRSGSGRPRWATWVERASRRRVAALAGAPGTGGTARLPGRSRAPRRAAPPCRGAPAAPAGHVGPSRRRGPGRARRASSHSFSTTARLWEINR